MNTSFNWKDFDKLFVGVDQLFENAGKILDDSASLVSTYPPYNTIKTEDGYKIELAVAGYSLENIEMTVDSKALTITGKKEPTENNFAKYLHAGLAKRAFSKKFLLSQVIDKDSIAAELKDGILTITLKNLPSEESKARKVKIKG